MRVALLALALVAVAAMLPSCTASSYPNRHLPDSNTTVRLLVRRMPCPLVSARETSLSDQLPFHLSDFRYPPTFPRMHVCSPHAQVLAMQPLAYGGQYIVVLGRDGQLWRVYQKNDAAMSWVDWAPLTQACPWKNDTQRSWYAVVFRLFSVPANQLSQSCSFPLLMSQSKCLSKCCQHNELPPVPASQRL